MLPPRSTRFADSCVLARRCKSHSASHSRSSAVKFSDESFPAREREGGSESNSSELKITALNSRGQIIRCKAKSSVPHVSIRGSLVSHSLFPSSFLVVPGIPFGKFVQGAFFYREHAGRFFLPLLKKEDAIQNKKKTSCLLLCSLFALSLSLSHALLTDAFVRR